MNSLSGRKKGAFRKKGERKRREKNPPIKITPQRCHCSEIQRRGGGRKEGKKNQRKEDTLRSGNLNSVAWFSLKKEKRTSQIREKKGDRKMGGKFLKVV